MKNSESDDIICLARFPGNAILEIQSMHSREVQMEGKLVDMHCRVTDTVNALFNRANVDSRQFIVISYKISMVPQIHFI